MTSKKQIAIVAWGAMADVLYATPIVRHIRSMHKTDVITWLIRDKFAEVVELNTDIDIVHKFALPINHSSRQEAEHVMDAEILEHANANYDLVYDLQYWPRYNNFYEHPNEDFVSLRARNAGIDPTKIVDRSIQLILSRGDYEALDDFMKNNDLTGRFITVNHISYAASPCWSFENYSSLVGALSHLDVKCIFTGAPNEPIPDGVIDARGMPYRQWARLIGISNLYLGLDSGAIALACASSTPIIKLHSRDFPINKTGVRAMGLRNESVLELCPAPSVDIMKDLIMENMR